MINLLLLYDNHFLRHKKIYCMCTCLVGGQKTWMKATWAWPIVVSARLLGLSSVMVLSMLSNTYLQIVLNKWCVIKALAHSYQTLRRTISKYLGTQTNTGYQNANCGKRGCYDESFNIVPQVDKHCNWPQQSSSQHLVNL